MRKTILIFVLLLSLPFTLHAVVIDLGKQGYTEPVDIAGLASQNTALIQKELGKIDPNSFMAKEVVTPSVSFRTKLPLAAGPRTFTKSLPPKAFYPDTTMVFFSADSRCEDFLRGKKFNYGYCVSYKSSLEVNEFAKRLGMTYPIALINDDKALGELGIKSFPAVLSVKAGVITITEGVQ